MFILGIETSCDETAASIVEDGETICSNVVASSLKEHSQFGGVVPEIACRYHVEWIDRTVSEALEKAKISSEEIDAVAVTQGPGLPGALMVGLSMAKAVAFALGKPLLGIHHLQAHLYANFLHNRGESPGGESPLFPYMGLIVSGGHTLLVLVRDIDEYTVVGQTIDDAAGEAFDKVARLLGLGYPGGPIIDARSKKGDSNSISFPRGMIHEKNFDFSFSGIKTAVLYYLQKQMVPGRRGGNIDAVIARSEGTKQSRFKKQDYFVPSGLAMTQGNEWRSLKPAVVNDVCASFQEAVVDVLVKKSLRACEEFGTKALIVGGGVAANSRLREFLIEEGDRAGLQILFPPKGLSIDNAAMVAGLGGVLFKRGYQSELSLAAKPNWNIETGGKSCLTSKLPRG